MQFGIEERKFGIEESNLKLLEQESTVKMENLKAEADWAHLNIEMEWMKLKVDLLHQRVQLLKEGVLQDEPHGLKFVMSAWVFSFFECDSPVLYVNTNIAIHEEYGAWPISVV